MPKRKDLNKVLIIGSGPIVIGQACEFDYSGTQACKALREEGIEIVLINSNPATIMTDPEVAHHTYIEPILPEAIDKILEREAELRRPVDALLPTLGGQTGLNCAAEAAERGILDKYGVRMIGASPEVIRKAEDRMAFKAAMQRIGLDVPRSRVAHSLDEATAVLAEVGLPCCIRPAYTLGGTGGGFVTTHEEFRVVATAGLEASRIGAILIEEGLAGWKEYELEVMRDRADNVVIICSIENVDPMGVHTGDSITVAPAMTLSDAEYQQMRDAAIAIMREIGVETGGSNIQFAACPQTGRQVVIEMNPRVSRSSALASKATGYPIAKIAAKLAIGFTLDELPNDITRKTPACFEPSIDYVVVKMPRWAFEKFPEADETLGTQMKSVGEAMAIGRTFKEALQKCIRSMEVKRFGLGLDANDKWLAWLRRRRPTPAPAAAEPPAWARADGLMGRRSGEAPPDWQEEAATDWPIPADILVDKLSRPAQGRLYYIRYAFKLGWSIEQVQLLTKIDPWFLDNIKQLVEFEEKLSQFDFADTPFAVSDELLETYREARRLGYSEVQLMHVWRVGTEKIGRIRRLCERPVYKLVDTCAAEFEAYTPYFYSSHETPAQHLVPAGATGAAAASRAELLAAVAADRGVTGPLEVCPLPDGELLIRACDDELRLSGRPKVVILGGGPNRIGQGIEFDYCCVHAVQAARDMGFEAVMVNSNPETVSTDYDTSDMLFFEPLTHEDVLNICRRLMGEHERDPAKRALLKGVIVQFGGQTPLNLAGGLKAAGVPIVGTSPESIHLAEDREQFQAILNELRLTQPPNGVAFSSDEAEGVADRIGYPVLVRPSYVLGGRAMEVCNHRQELRRYMTSALEATDRAASGAGRGHPILIDKFLIEATEVDVDAVSDFGSDNDDGTCLICGVMEHIEEAGIHSGDSGCALPPYSLSPGTVDEIKRQTRLLARRLGVCGLMNVQFAVKDGQVCVLEVNPRASRTVPFVSKATGVAWARLATQVMLGRRLADLAAEHDLLDAPTPAYVSVKQPVFPFNKFRGVDVVLGPEMRSTGESMGIDRQFALAYAKACLAAGVRLPTAGIAFVSVNDHDKPLVVPIAAELAEMGFALISTRGTASVLAGARVEARLIPRISEGMHPNMLDLIEARTVQLLINTPSRKGRHTDEGRIRAAATIHNIPLITTITGARAAVAAIRELRKGTWPVRSLQEYFMA